MLERLNQHYPIRYTAVLFAVFFSIIFAVVWLATGSGGFVGRCVRERCQASGDGEFGL